MGEKIKPGEKVSQHESLKYCTFAILEFGESSRKKYGHNLRLRLLRRRKKFVVTGHRLNKFLSRAVELAL